VEIFASRAVEAILNDMQSIQKNTILNGVITLQGKGGEGTLLWDKMPVYVPHTVIGDVIDAKVVKVEKRRAYGRLLCVHSPGEDRVRSRCTVAHLCGGCQLQHQSYAGQLGFKTTLVWDRLSRYLPIPDSAKRPIIPCPNPWGTRNKMQLAAGMDTTGLTLGLYASRSHRVVDMPYCPVMSAPMNGVVQVIKQWHLTNPVPVFNETTGVGVLRYVTIRYSESMGQLMVIITVAKAMDMALLVTCLKRIIGMTSIYITYQHNPKSDHVLGTELQHIWGDTSIDDVVFGITCQVSPRSFMQANGRLVDTLYQTVLDAIPTNAPVIDLHCGTGVLTCALATRHGSVVGVDINHAAIQDAKKNAQNNGVEVSFYAMDAGEYITRHSSQSSTVILDPPRQGCTDTLIQTLIHQSPQTLVYVSCYPDTLGRDLRALTQGGYAVHRIQVVDMFCHTVHVECVAVLYRRVLKG